MTTLTVSCLACHAPMVERLNRENGSRFLGCSRYPTCLSTQKIPAWMEMRRAGAVELPGFESEED